jgi:hypothetical protein
MVREWQERNDYTSGGISLYSKVIGGMASFEISPPFAANALADKT